MSKKKKKSNSLAQGIVITFCGILALIFAGTLLVTTGKTDTHKLWDPTDSAEVATPVTQETETETEAPTEPDITLTYPTVSSTCQELTNKNITADYAVLLDLTNNEIIAESKAEEKIYPASMTKIMTLLIAAENIEDFNDTFTMTEDIINPLIEQDASRAGFDAGETITLTDLMYGVALPSGADATTALAIYIAGSEDAFVDLMNEKVADLGLKNTHFMNASGLHDDNHYSTATDIALLMSYVMENDMCREVLGTYQYTTSITEQHPEGILLTSTMYSRMYGDECVGMTIEAGKTGYTDMAGQCLVSYATEDATGKPYICVVANAKPTYWRSIFDTLAIYGIVNGGYEMPTDLIWNTEETDENGNIIETESETEEIQ